MTDKLFSWERIPSVDVVNELLAERVQQGALQALLLGHAADGTPLFALGVDEPGRPLLLVGGGSGDSVVGVAAAAELLCGPAWEGWQRWAICGLDVPRLRHNDAQLAGLRPSPAEQATARRVAWGPGEDPERSVPLDSDGLYQPDALPADAHWPENVPVVSSQGLALARAVVRLRPELVVSLRDVPAGGAFLASGQPLDQEDAEQLLTALCGELLPAHRAQRLWPGTASDAQPAVLTLPSAAAEASVARAGHDQALAVGPGGIWQLLRQLHPQALYLTAAVPRLTHPDLGDDRPGAQTRAVQVSEELRTVKNREQRVGVHVLRRPGHPADGQELRVARLGGEEDLPAGEHPAASALCGWLAVEALLVRRETLRQALEAWQDAFAHLEDSEAERALQLLSASAPQDSQLRAFQTNKRFGRPATVAETRYWTSVYPLETAGLLGEALRCLDAESRVDRQVVQLRERLQQLLDAQLAACQELQAPPAPQLAERLQALAHAAVAVTSAGGPARRLAHETLAAADRQLTDARRHERAMRHLKRPPADRQQAAERVAAAEARLQAAQRHQQQLDGAPATTTPAPEPAREPAPAPEPAQEPAPAPEPVREPAPAPEPVRSPALVPEPPQASAPAPAPAAEAPAPPAPEALPQMPAALRPPPVQVGSSAPESLDIEALLPERLRLPREWGVGPLYWEDQLPPLRDKPLLQSMLQQLINAGQPAPRSPAPAAHGELEEQAPSSQELQEPVAPGTIAVQAAAAVGFLRRRVELPHRFRPDDPQPLPRIPASGGRFRLIVRRRLDVSSAPAQR